MVSGKRERVIEARGQHVQRLGDKRAHVITSTKLTTVSGGHWGLGSMQVGSGHSPGEEGT